MTPNGLWRRNGLSLALIGLLLACLVGQCLSGWHVFNEFLHEHGRRGVPLLAYLGTGHFVSAMFENWESEFLQMGIYVLLTAKLYQHGSAESRDFDPEPERGAHTARARRPRSVNRGGAWLRLYENSLSLALLGLFALSFVLHLCGSWRAHALEHELSGQTPPSLVQHLGSADFWFESFQNWQSEFLAVLALVVLSIFLRQRGSPQSKAVEAPHSQTGT